ncbi:MAG: PHP domain-containing protein [Planctomycetota bacterium]|jgi:predicted metal-dependent phosphoesterase TrpH
MKVELHCHTMHYSGCAANTAEEMMAALIEAGYGAVYLTEHNFVWQPEELADLQAAFPQIRIFGGVELADTETAQHVLVLGTSDPVYVNLALASEWAEVLARARDEGHLVSIAHPCRFEGGHDLLHDGLQVDAIEHCTPNHDDAMSLSACAIAERRNLPLVNAGDLHSTAMVDRYWIETEHPVERADDIRSIIVDRAYRNCVGDLD